MRRVIVEGDDVLALRHRDRDECVVSRHEVTVLPVDAHVQAGIGASATTRYPSPCALTVRIRSPVSVVTTTFAGAPSAAGPGLSRIAVSSCDGVAREHQEVACSYLR